jgi:hypothetical protein
MKIRAQFAMVFNLDKCIGCHTCSVTCKNVWTNRKGVEYAWFNNVESKPGVGYPEAMGKPGKVEGRLGKAQRQAGAEGRRPGEEDRDRSSPTPTCRRSTTTTSPSPTITPVCRTLPCPKRRPRRGPVSQITGEKMEKITLGPQLGGRPGRRVRQAFPGRQLLEHGKGDVQAVREHLPHVPAAHLQSLHQPGLRRLLPLRRNVQAGGGRHRAGRPGPLPGLAHVHLRLPLQEGVLQLGIGQGREVHRLLSPRRIGHAHGVLRILRRPHPLQRHHPLRRRQVARRRQHPHSEQDLYKAHLDSSSIPTIRPSSSRPQEGRRARALDRGGAESPPSTRWRWTGRSPSRCTPSSAPCR